MKFLSSTVNCFRLAWLYQHGFLNIGLFFIFEHFQAIRPYETKNLGQVLIIGGSETNTTAFVRVIGVVMSEYVFIIFHVYLLVCFYFKFSPPVSHEIFLNFPIEVTKKAAVFPSSDVLGEVLFSNFYPRFSVQILAF